MLHFYTIDFSFYTSITVNRQEASHVVTVKIFWCFILVSRGMSSTMRRYRPVVIAGPSGSGKSTLYKKLMEEFKDCFAFSVSRKF